MVQDAYKIFSSNKDGAIARSHTQNLPEFILNEKTDSDPVKPILKGLLIDTRTIQSHSSISQ